YIAAHVVSGCRPEYRQAMPAICSTGDLTKSLGLSPGDSLLSDSENIFSLAGVYPLKMKVVGVLGHADTPDDSAVFVDVKTAWIIAGLGHGHQDLSEEESADAVLKKDEQLLTANASVLTFTEVTPENASTFHFHGSMESLPLTAVIAIPKDQRSKTLLMGRYQASDEVSQILQPSSVMEELLATVLRVRTFVLAGALLLGVATALSVMMVFALSIRLRRPELETMRKIGATRFRLLMILVWEILLVISLSVSLAVGMTYIIKQFGEQVIRWMLV
ncbi:MAG: hypothetical protein AAF483_21165, partial [Planctomycetota bacterium]